MVEDFKQANIVLLGTLTNARLDDGTTDLVIEKVVKRHPCVDGKKTLTLPRYIDFTRSRFIVFCNVRAGKLDPFRGVEIQDGSELVGYFEKAVKLADRPPGERLRYYFDFLPSADTDIAQDAFREFARADYEHYRGMAGTLDPDSIAAWLQDVRTSPTRYGLYGSLLGHCGKARHAGILQSLIDDPAIRSGLGLDGLLAGLIMIQPRSGWETLQSILKDPRQGFAARYSALRTVRFLKQFRPDLVAPEELTQGVRLLLAHDDMADLATQELRKWDASPDADPVPDSAAMQKWSTARIALYIVLPVISFVLLLCLRRQLIMWFRRACSQGLK